MCGKSTISSEMVTFCRTRAGIIQGKLPKNLKDLVTEKVHIAFSRKPTACRMLVRHLHKAKRGKTHTLPSKRGIGAFDVS